MKVLYIVLRMVFRRVLRVMGIREVVMRVVVRMLFRMVMRVLMIKVVIIKVMRTVVWT